MKECLYSTITTVHKLKWTISHCNQSIPFYRKTLDPYIEDGLNIRKIEEFDKIPYTDYSRLPDEYQNDPYRILAHTHCNMEKVIYNEKNDFLIGYTSGDLYCLGKTSERLLRLAKINRLSTVLIQRGFEGVEIGLKNLEVNYIILDNYNISDSILGMIDGIIGDENFITQLFLKYSIRSDIIIISNTKYKGLFIFSNPFYKLIDIGFGLGSGVGILNCVSKEIYFDEYSYYIQWEKNQEQTVPRLIVTSLTMEAAPLLKYRTNYVYVNGNFSSII